MSRTSAKFSGARATFAAIALFATAVQPAVAASDSTPSTTITADLDGKRIALSDVANWYCHDFAYPQIHCRSTAESLEWSIRSTLAVTATDYVVIYEFPTYAGSYMYVSENYTVLALIGWNDRISSFRGRNSASGYFFVDWYYGGTAYGFCCNVNVPSLGSFDDSFSSVHRN